MAKGAKIIVALIIVAIAVTLVVVFVFNPANSTKYGFPAAAVKLVPYSGLVDGTPGFVTVEGYNNPGRQIGVVTMSGPATITQCVADALMPGNGLSMNQSLGVNGATLVNGVCNAKAFPSMTGPSEGAVAQTGSSIGWLNNSALMTHMWSVSSQPPA